jgi:hypothetical protein
MATNININVEGRDLVERAKQQQRDARTNRLTRESITTDAATNRETLLGEPTTAAQVLAPTRSIDTDTDPYIRVSRPAATRIPNNAFLVVTNLNYVYPDDANTHRVYITDPSGRVNALPGLLDSSMVDFMNRTYLFLSRGKTLADFKRSVPYDDIFTTLDTYYTPTPEESPRAVNFIEPMLALSPFRPAKSTAYTVSLTGDRQSFTGNSGAVMAGYLNTRTYYIDEWFTSFEGGFQPIRVDGVQWGVTNTALTSRYPPGYPL